MEYTLMDDASDDESSDSDEEDDEDSRGIHASIPDIDTDYESLSASAALSNPENLQAPYTAKIWTCNHDFTTIPQWLQVTCNHDSTTIPQ